MAKHEGWDTELFVEPPSDNDLCDICCGVLDDAVETGCGHTFCEKCIREWLEQRQVCPQDQKPLSWADCRAMVRDRRRILDLKVKCPWCQIVMELRELREHKKSKCQQKPDDYEPTPEPEQVKEEKAGDQEYVLEFEAAEDKQIEENKIAEERRIREQKDSQEKDRLFAQQMQLSEQDRARGLSVRPASPLRASVAPASPLRASVAPASPLRASVSPQQQKPAQPQIQLGQVGEPHVDYLGSPQNGGGGGGGGGNNNNGVFVEYYQADEIGYGEGQEGQPDAQGKKIRQQKKSGCCGCSDRCWCCMCCVFWIFLLILGVCIWLFGVGGTASKIGV